MKLLCAFAAFAVAAAANPNLILSHEGLEAGLKLDSNGDINVYAADDAEIDRGQVTPNLIGFLAYTAGIVATVDKRNKGKTAGQLYSSNNLSVTSLMPLNFKLEPKWLRYPKH